MTSSDEGGNNGRSGIIRKIAENALRRVPRPLLTPGFYHVPLKQFEGARFKVLPQPFTICRIDFEHGELYSEPEYIDTHGPQSRTDFPDIEAAIQFQQREYSPSRIFIDEEILTPSLAGSEAAASE